MCHRSTTHHTNFTISYFLSIPVKNDKMSVIALSQPSANSSLMI